MIIRQRGPAGASGGTTPIAAGTIFGNPTNAAAPPIAINAATARDILEVPSDAELAALLALFAQKGASNTFTASQSIIAATGLSNLFLGAAGSRINDDGGLRIRQEGTGGLYCDFGSDGFFLRRNDNFATLLRLDWLGNLSLVGPVMQGYLAIATSPTMDHIEAGRILPVYDTVRQRLRYWQRIANTISLMDFSPGIREKQDWLWNFDRIPDFSSDGMPNPADGDLTSLIGLYFDKNRAHFVCGRINQRACYKEFNSQYSLTAGWAAHSIDATADPTGRGSKGVATVGYQVVSCGHGSSNFGTNNVITNSGASRGTGNIAGGFAMREILSHNWVNENTAVTITVEGDYTAFYTANSLCVVKLVSPGQTQAVTPNKVVSSSYNSGTDRTTIVLHTSMAYAPTASTTPNGHGIIDKPLIFALGSGPVDTFAEGLENVAQGDQSWAQGVGCKTLGQYSRATGKHAVTKNHAEQSWSGGAIIDGDALRPGQRSDWHLKRKTTDGTATVLTCDGNAPNGYVNLLRFTNNAVVACKIHVIAWCQFHQESYTKIWDNVVIRQQGNGDTAILHASTPIEVTETNTADFDATITANANGELSISVTATPISGNSNRDVMWHAFVEGPINMYAAPTRIN